MNEGGNLLMKTLKTLIATIFLISLCGLIFVGGAQAQITIPENIYCSVTITINGGSIGYVSLAGYPTGEIVWATAVADDLTTDTTFQIWLSKYTTASYSPFWMSENINDNGTNQFIAGASMPKFAPIPINVAPTYMIAKCTNTQTSKTIKVDFVVKRNAATYTYQEKSITIANGAQTGYVALTEHGVLASICTLTPAMTGAATTTFEIRNSSTYSATQYLWQSSAIASATTGNLFNDTNYNQLLPLNWTTGTYINAYASAPQTGAKTIPVYIVYRNWSCMYDQR